ncbi:uncharacterized protein LOC127282400 [Leptopilina boulardi]|uniref:uncharacterized protein LOC127282400 n=1 Tax=Leptopilina boulardi TaxID=63433 RepID=UPI0021F53CEE|nr:uncharacterized protein LOC127282400 [Leptopilina boulardi]
MSLINNCVNSILLTGSKKLNKFFLFEAAVYWAEQGHRVFYFGPEKLQSSQFMHHDRSNPNSEAFKMMRFIYVSNYEALVEQLVDVHTIAPPPSVLLVDDFDNYIHDSDIKEKKEVHIARLCALLFDTMNTCAEILERKVHIFISISSELNFIHQIYFNKFWTIEEENENIVKLKQIGNSKIYEYRKFDNNNIILKQIIYD